MKQYIAIICGVILGTFLVLTFIDWLLPDPPPVFPTAAISVDASDSLTYRPIQALSDDWYLVEITYPHTCENPFPIGKAKMVMVVPHLVRMHASELDKLDKLDNPGK